MRKLFGSILVVLLFATVASAQDITSEKIQDDVLVVMGAGGNITAINTSDGLLVVDTFLSPSTARKARAEIEKAFPGVPVRYVINTHYHWDHTFGNQEFKDALIIAHINNSDRVRTRYSERAAEYAGSAQKISDLEKHLAEHAGKDPEKAEEVKKELERWRGIRENYGEFELVPAPFSLDGGARIEHGGKTFYIYHFGAGHTDGDVVVFSKEDRVLVMGDLLLHHSLPFIDYRAGADVPNWIATLSKLIAKADTYETVVPGHGAVGTVQALRDKKGYLQDLWDAVKNAREKGLTLDQAKEQITLEKYKDYGWRQQLPANIEACWNMMEK